MSCASKLHTYWLCGDQVRLATVVFRWGVYFTKEDFSGQVGRGKLLYNHTLLSKTFRNLIT